MENNSSVYYSSSRSLAGHNYDNTGERFSRKERILLSSVPLYLSRTGIEYKSPQSLAKISELKLTDYWPYQ
jgi:hypothetical protein